jgi:two-component system sensor histidine kinase/response regulator
LELEKSPFSLRSTVEDTLPSLAVRAHQKGLELLCRIPPEIPDALVGDHGRLRQILTNLLSNAIKFTHEGEILLQVDLESASERELLLHFTVRDTGIGIPQDKQSIIFEAFTQVDNSFTRGYGGTGLGLAISSQLISILGGRIWVESQLGHGSTFHFTAPFARQTETASPGPHCQQELEQVPILLVDDNPTSRLILRELLLAWRMQPAEASTAAAALTELKHRTTAGAPYPLVVVDALLPEQDGFTLAKNILTQNLAGHVVLLLSSADHLTDANRCRTLGLPFYLVKPVRQSELSRALVRALGGSVDRSTTITLRKPGTQLQSQCPRRILLAEDHPVNQRLAIRLLERWGHSVHLVSNGLKALEACRSQEFDLIFLDVQMPEMSGLEAATAIRKEEKHGKHTPIIAMTAHAMKGDRERCLQAGMDFYIAKPLNTQALFELIEQIQPGQTSPPKPDTSTIQASTDFDLNKALTRLDGDLPLLQELAQMFLQDSPALLRKIETCLEQQDSKGLERAAHALRGAVGNFGAYQAQEAARRLENMGRASQLDEARKALAQLQQEFARLTPSLNELVRGEAA